MSDLFDHTKPRPESAGRPLADRMRPDTLEALAGQEHITAPGSLFRAALEIGRAHV